MVKVQGTAQSIPCRPPKGSPKTSPQSQTNKSTFYTKFTLTINHSKACVGEEAHSSKVPETIQGATRALNGFDTPDNKEKGCAKPLEVLCAKTRERHLRQQREKSHA
eukprot:4814055-Amphidinium_carterae.1